MNSKKNELSRKLQDAQLLVKKRAPKWVMKIEGKNA
jgi:hypothetical protein